MIDQYTTNVIGQPMFNTTWLVSAQCNYWCVCPMPGVVSHVWYAITKFHALFHPNRSPARMPTIALAEGNHATETFECDSSPDMNLNGDKYNVRPIDLPINKFWVPQNILTWELPLQPMFYTGRWWWECVYQGCILVYLLCKTPTTNRLQRIPPNKGWSPIPYPHLWLSL